MPKFNGHRNWNAWNVSLWINNDEGLYGQARRLAHHYPRPQAAAEMLRNLREMGQYSTPDGAPYTVTTIREAMRGILL